MTLRTHYTNEIEQSDGTVKIGGWVHEIKDLAKTRFIWVRDERGIAQVTIVKQDAPKEILQITEQLAREDVVLVEGERIKERIAKVGAEIRPSRIQVLAKTEETVPLDVADKTEANLDVRLDWRYLDLRRPANHAIFRIQAKLIEGMEQYLREQGFVQVFTPCLIGGTSEGGAEVFKVDYFGKDGFLRQDPQLHRQLTIAGGLDRIYDLGPNWRAELSHTPRHLCEHHACAPEFAFMADETDMERVEEGLVISALQSVKESCGAELELLKIELRIPRTPFPEVRFPEIYDVLSGLGKNIAFGEDYDREAEQLLSNHFEKAYDSEFFFVNRFPSKVKPFYVMRVDDDAQWARSVDLVFRGLELSSGGQREHRYPKIMQQIKEKGVNQEGLRWFTDAFKFGVPPHGGFAIGIERFTASLLNIANLREAALFPRSPERLLP
jgi:aspartyl-tRNA synthetase